MNERMCFEIYNYCFLGLGLITKYSVEVLQSYCYVCRLLFTVRSDPNQYFCQLDAGDEKQLIPEASDFIDLESTIEAINPNFCSLQKFKLKCLQ